MVAVYLIGVLSCVYHLANGLWTMGITWGVWTSPQAQARASAVCGAFGVLLAVVSVAALFGMRAVGSGEALEHAKQVEDQMYESKVDLVKLPRTSTNVVTMKKQSRKAT